MSRSSRLLGWALAAGVALSGCAALRSPTAATAPPAGEAASNVMRGDYAGSAACAPCHADIYARWQSSPMHRMTRLATGGAIKAPFDGSTIRFKGDSVTVEQRNGARYMRLVTAKRGERLYRVTKVIGGRYREDYAGVEVTGIGPGGAAVVDERAEAILPLSWLLFSGAWRYKGYSVMVTEREGLRPGMSWRQTCIYCHNTAPYIASLYDDLLDEQTPYQGAMNDRLLPPSRRWKLEVTDPSGLALAIQDETARIQGKRGPAHAAGGGAALDDTLRRAVKASLRHVDQADLVEVGIGCESCHNGSRDHAEGGSRLPSFEVQSPFFQVREPGAGDRGARPTRAAAINRVCARCHSVLLSAYPFTWEGGRRYGDAGGSSTNSGEARDFLLGGCAGAMSCADCHDPHTEDPKAALDRLGTTAGNAVCTRCHGELAGDAATAAHTHHAKDSEGSACLNCHMPRKNTGLAYRLTRYHRIGSPTDADRVERDRPIECALCHADRSVASLVGDLERWWGKRYDRAALTSLYGPDLGVSALEATLTRGRPHEQVAAAVALAERVGEAALPAIAAQLTHDYPLVRYYAGHAMEEAAGRPLGIDLDGDRDAIREAARRWIEPPR